MAPAGRAPHGLVTRILASHFEPAQGANQDNPIEGDLTADPPQYLGNLQPYRSTCRRTTPWARPTSSRCCCTRWTTTTTSSRTRPPDPVRQPRRRHDRADARRPQPRQLVLRASEVDVFEAWADVAAHYPLNPAPTASRGTRWAATARTRFGRVPRPLQPLGVTVGGPYVGLGAIIGRPTVQQPERRSSRCSDRCATSRPCYGHGGRQRCRRRTRSRRKCASTR